MSEGPCWGGGEGGAGVNVAAVRRLPGPSKGKAWLPCPAGRTSIRSLETTTCGCLWVVSTTICTDWQLGQKERGLVTRTPWERREGSRGHWAGEEASQEGCSWELPSGRPGADGKQAGLEWEVPRGLPRSRRAVGIPEDTRWPGRKMMGQESDTERKSFLAPWAGPTEPVSVCVCLAGAVAVRTWGLTQGLQGAAVTVAFTDF